MPDVFDYDVFLSFSSRDEETVKPIWQEFSQNGLRVFWSDETLKQNVGQSFFEVIQEALINSRHLVLLMSANAAQSEWVKLEYGTFFNQCHLPTKGERRLIIHPIGGYDTSRLPPFLKNLQIARSVKAIIPLLGGVDIEALRRENAELREQLEAANNQLQKLRDEVEGLRRLNIDANQKFLDANQKFLDANQKSLDTNQKFLDTNQRLLDANQQIRDLKAAAQAPPREKVENQRTKLRPPVALRPAGQPLEEMPAEENPAGPEEARPPVVALVPVPRQQSEVKIGRVTNYFAKIGVAVVSLDDELRRGDKIRIKGHTTDFEQTVKSPRVADKLALVAPPGEASFKTTSPCRKGDVVYRVG